MVTDYTVYFFFRVYIGCQNGENFKIHHVEAHRSCQNELILLDINFKTMPLFIYLPVLIFGRTFPFLLLTLYPVYPYCTA